jgi:chaperonin GroEL
MDTQKVKSVAKAVVPRGARLAKLTLETMRTVSEIVGGTLGPGGCPVLIERQEQNLPPMITKDGVTVFRSLGLEDPTAHCIMEAARDASVKTANEAGDGTTTATVLSEAIVRRTYEFCNKNPHVSPQKVTRRLERAFKEVIEPTVRSLSIHPDSSTEHGKQMLFNVARISANGDSELAKAVMECYEVVGDEGNVTIVESNGPSHYEVERINGYPVPMGYEDCAGKFYQKFVTDQGRQTARYERPVFVCYHGRINEIQTAVMLMTKIADAWQKENHEHNVVLVATGFSETVLANLAFNQENAGTVNVFPLLAPPSPMANGQLDFLLDVCAVSGAKLLDPLNAPLETADLDVLGHDVSLFEASRFRSIIFPKEGLEGELAPNENNVAVRVADLQAQLQSAASGLEAAFLNERIGKLTGGIAKLTVVGSSTGELREKRDRAEDAVCAVRGALKNGCLPGGGWGLLKIRERLSASTDPVDAILDDVLIPALKEPVTRILSNVGFNTDEQRDILSPIYENLFDPDGAVNPLTYDAFEHKHVRAYDVGLLDSTPAVLEAIRNSISIASLLGTLGGTVVYKRDITLERSEAEHASNYLRADDSVPPELRP